MGNKKNKSRTVIYTKEDYENDQNRFEKSIKNGNVDWSNFSRLMVHDLCTRTNIIDNGCIGDIKLGDIELALKYPKQGWRILLRTSEQLMRVSPHYYRMNNLYSNMALFCWWVDLYDVKENANVNNIKKKYSELAAKLETMNLKHEFSKIMKVIPYQDIYCGLVFEDSSDFFFQQIDYKICELYQIQDGLYNFRINLDRIDAKYLKAYPNYVQQAWIDLRDGNLNSNIEGQWYTPPADKQICLKMNPQWEFPYPILISLIKDILDLDVYKKLKLQSARTDNYKAIAVEVPIDENTVDKPLLTPDTLGIFAEMNRESMSDDIGLLHTLGSHATPISFKDSSNTRNNVGDAIDSLYDASGISKENFNGSSSATALGYSIANDAAYIYHLYRQFERWCNRFIKLRKYNKPSFKFLFYLLDTTIYNQDDVISRYKDGISMGATVISQYMAALGATPSRVLGSYVVHEDIFDFRNHFIPLQTSYNSSVNGNSPGRPTVEEDGKVISESGEKTRDTDGNNR